MGSLGSDTGGSIRYPASLCGLVGMKATYGRVSSYGVVPLSWSLDHCGPMTWTVEDNALMLQAIAGYDPKDPTSTNTPVPDFTRDLRSGIEGLIVGIPREYFFDPAFLDPDQLSAVESAIQVLESLGATTKVIDVPEMDPITTAWSCVIMAEAYAYHENNIRMRGDEYGYIAPRIHTGAFYSAADYIQSQRIRRLTQQQYNQVMEQVDVIVTPTWQGPATRFDEIIPGAPLTKGFTWVFNFNGMPALSICCGFSSKGLPLGLQIAGRLFDEATVFRVAQAYENATPWHERRPSV
jgi:aspartyl-tRNA(Asn)/glutamyl-tRNA(Gln) amidotransferase subunit A